MNSTLTLTQDWDKTFPQNAAVDHCKVTFHNRFGIELAADLYKPKGAQGPFAAVAVSGPFGAVKEQCSGLYAQELAARGFLTVAFDPSYTGESGGTPRYVASPDINTEDFSAAVDFLSVRDDVDPERIGILGICGWGGMALNAKLLAYAEEIRSAVLMIYGDKAHSCYFSRDAFTRLQGDNKELLLIPGAVHTDLYDRMDIIPFDRIEAFYHQYLK